MKSSNKSTPEPTLSKMLVESTTSSLMSESVVEPEDGQELSSSAVCSVSTVSLPPNEHQTIAEHDRCRKVPVLHSIIVERLDIRSCKMIAD